MERRGSGGATGPSFDPCQQKMTFFLHNTSGASELTPKSQFFFSDLETTHISESREKLGFGPLGQGEHLGRFLDENG